MAHRDGVAAIDPARCHAREAGDQRTGVFTSGIVATMQGRQIALYFTGAKHAGENLAEVLKRRAAELPPLIPMRMLCPATCLNCPPG